MAQGLGQQSLGVADYVGLMQGSYTKFIPTIEGQLQFQIQWDEGFHCLVEIILLAKLDYYPALVLSITASLRDYIGCYLINEWFPTQV